MADPKQQCVLIANRGEVARRIIKTCNRLGVRTLAVFTTPDALAPHMREATKAVCVGDNPREYTNAGRLVEVRHSPQDYRHTQQGAVVPGARGNPGGLRGSCARAER